MTLFDQHLHSYHSVDSQADPRANVEAALGAGLAGLTFTEHFDMHPDDRSDCRYDDGAYSETISHLRSEYGSQIFIGKGIEVCYQRDLMDEIIPFLAGHEFDLVILSVHYFQGAAVHHRNEWDGIDVLDGTRRYLETVLEAVRFCGELRASHGRVFDVLGHLDLVKRYTNRFFGQCAVGAFGGLIDEILRGCLAADLTPEINTSTLRQGLDETMPGPETVKRYAELGGTSMSLGSDAHRSEDVDAGLDHAVKMLRDGGITHMAVFESRRKRETPIDKSVSRAAG